MYKTDAVTTCIAAIRNYTQYASWPGRNIRDKNVAYLICQTDMINARILKRNPLKFLHLSNINYACTPNMWTQYSSRVHVYHACLIKYNSHYCRWKAIQEMFESRSYKTSIFVIVQEHYRNNKGIVIVGNERKRKRTRERENERLSLETLQRPVEAALSW